jgi:para-aminobenzoate synthetase component I
MATSARSATSRRGQQRKTDAEIALRLEQIAAFAKCPQTLKHFPRPRIANSNQTREEYFAKVKRALQYISAGDIYQVNLAQKFTTQWTESAADLYLKMREQNPAQFGAFLGPDIAGKGKSICSISPELFISVRGDEIITRPIKGTRPRGNTQSQDLAARRELESCAKERAELNMIVDLERNDLGRVCHYGSVEVLSDGEIETLPTVFHRVATIRGRLKPGVGPASLCKAMFPGGSVTGAPKIRAMQIIKELEPEPRGPYCGAIGWLGYDGNMEFSIAIRTAIHDAVRGEASYHAGSGIVADSDPEKEYQETLHKAAAFFRATNSTFEI